MERLKELIAETEKRLDDLHDSVQQMIAEIKTSNYKLWRISEEMGKSQSYINVMLSRRSPGPEKVLKIARGIVKHGDK